MKHSYQHIGLAKLCGWFGLSRQSYYQHARKATRKAVEEEVILQRVKQIRKDHRRMGVRKLYGKLQPLMEEHRIKMGRDALFDLLSANGLLVRKRKRRVRTTQSFHWLRKYPNLIGSFVPGSPNQLWVSDITYWKISDRYVYISLITDAYSHKIVGYHLAQTLEANESIQALKMALSGWDCEGSFQLIHHSDRGVQYCSADYIKLLQDHGILISMAEKGDPLENPIAERVNGIIKEEYLYQYLVSSVEQAKELLVASVDLYNSDRPHMSIGNRTPEQIHQATKPTKTKKLWKSYYQKKEAPVKEFQD